MRRVTVGAEEERPFVTLDAAMDLRPTVWSLVRALIQDVLPRKATAYLGPAQRTPIPLPMTASFRRGLVVP